MRVFAITSTGRYVDYITGFWKNVYFIGLLLQIPIIGFLLHYIHSHVISISTFHTSIISGASILLAFILSVTISSILLFVKDYLSIENNTIHNIIEQDLPILLILLILAIQLPIVTSIFSIDRNNFIFSIFFVGILSFIWLSIFSYTLFYLLHKFHSEILNNTIYEISKQQLQQINNTLQNENTIDFQLCEHDKNSVCIDLTKSSVTQKIDIPQKEYIVQTIAEKVQEHKYITFHTNGDKLYIVKDLS